MARQLRISKSTTSDANSKLKKQVSNYKTRFQAARREDPTDTRNALEKVLNLEKDQNVLFDIFEILDRPRNALFTAIDEAASGGNFLEGLGSGITGETKTSGKDLLLNHTNLDDEEGKLNWVDVLGTGLDIVGDPTSYLLAPVKVASSADDIAKGAKAMKWALNSRQGWKPVDQVAMGLLGKAAKVPFKAGNWAIETGLKMSDAKQLARLDDLAGDIPREVYAKLNNIDLSKVGTGLEDFRATKSKFVDAFDQAKTSLGRFKKIKAGAEGSNELSDIILQKSKKDVQDLSYDFVMKNIDTSLYKSDLDDLNKYLNNPKNQKKGKTITDWISSSDSELAKILKSEGNKVAIDITDFIESSVNDRNMKNILENKTLTGKNLSANQILKEWQRGGSKQFVGSADSVNALQKLVDKYAKQKGLKTNAIPQIASEVNATQIRDLQALLPDLSKVQPGTAEYDNIINSLTKEQRNVLNKLTALQNQNSTLKFDNNIINQLAKDTNFRKELQELGLNYNLEYNFDELENLRKLFNNKDFVNLAERGKGLYQKATDIFNKTNGTDFSDITDIEDYVRRARGSKYDVDQRILDLQEAINDPAVPQQVREFYQEQIDDLMNQSNNFSGGSELKSFSSRKTKQPAKVVDRQMEEARQANLKTIKEDIVKVKEKIKYQEEIVDVKKSASKLGIDTTKSVNSQVEQINNLLKNKDLSDADRNTLENLKNGLTGKSSTTDYLLKVKKNKEAKLVKQGTTLGDTEKAIQNVINTIDNVMREANDNLIDKGIRIMQDSKGGINLHKQFADIDRLTSDVNTIKKQLNNVENLSDADVNKLLKKLYSTENKVNKKAASLSKSLAVIDGKVEKTLTTEIGQNIKKMEKYAESKDMLESLKAERASITANSTAIKDSISELNQRIERSINKQIDAYTNITEETLQAEKDKLRALSKSESILNSEEGLEMFDLNFFAGFDDFVNYANMTNKTAKLYRDALTNSVFNDTDIFIPASQIGNKSKKGLVAITGSDIKKRLNSIHKLMGEDITSDQIKTLIDSVQGNTYYVDKRIANMFKLTNISDNEAKGLLNLIDDINNKFKKMSTLTPGFQVRNGIGNEVQMYLSGMPLHSLIPYQRKATKVLNMSEDIFNKLSKGIDLDENELKAFDYLKDFFEGGFYNAGTKVQDLEALEASIRAGKGVRAFNKVADLNMWLNNKNDSIKRMATLIYAKDDLAKGGKYVKNLGVDNAIDAVKYALMDPSSLSEFEQNTMKRLIPFYTFTKQNLMFQLTNIGKNTAKYKRLMKAINNMYDDLDEEGYYDYQKEAMQIPIPWLNDDNGNQVFLKANLPLSDLGEFLSDPSKRFASSLTPLIKAPIEATTGKSLFTGDDTTYNNMSKTFSKLGIKDEGVTNAIDGAELILNNFGLQNVSTNLVRKVAAILEGASGEKTAQQVWAEIFRSVLQNTNEENVALNNVYDDLELYQNEVSRLKKQGIDIPTIREITTSNKLKVNNLKKKRASSK